MNIPLSDPVEYLTRRKFPSYPHIEALQLSFGPGSSISTSGISHEDRQRLIKAIKSYKSELRAKPPEELQALYRQEKEKERQELEAKAELDEQQRFFNRPEAKADFTHWSKATYWTLDEAIALSFGKDPEVMKWDNLKEYVGRSPVAAKYGRVRDLVLRAKAWKQLYDPVLPGFFLAWARRNEIEVPRELVELVEARGIVIADWKDMFDKLKTQSDACTAAAETLFAVKEREIALLKQERDALREATAEDGPQGGADELRHTKPREAREKVLHDWEKGPSRFVSAAKAGRHYTEWLAEQGYQFEPRTVTDWIRVHAKKSGIKLR